MKAIFPYDDEARLKEEFFAGRNDGFFVEVGANDPVQWSQSYAFEQRGWTGVLVEPQPALAEKLKERRKAKVYAVACSSPANAGKPMRLTLAGIHLSLEASHFVFGMNREGVIEVPVTTLDQVLTDAQAPAPLDLLSIDVEGHEIDVLDGFDMARWRPRLLLIEDLVINLRLRRLPVRPRLQMGAPHRAQFLVRPGGGGGGGELGGAAAISAQVLSRHALPPSPGGVAPAAGESGTLEAGGGGVAGRRSGTDPNRHRRRFGRRSMLIRIRSM